MMSNNRKSIIAAMTILGIVAGGLGYNSMFVTQDGCIAPVTLPENGVAVKGYSFKIIAPDNRFCVLEDVVLSDKDYAQMQNNVGVFTVKEKTRVTAPQTHDYCDIAFWLYAAHEQTYPKIYKDFKHYMVPKYCEDRMNIPKQVNLTESLEIRDYETHDIPEFGSIAFIILSIAIICVIGLSLKTRRLNLVR